MSDEKERQAFVHEQGFLTAVLDEVQDAIIACDSEGRPTLFNRAAREFLGLPETAIPLEAWSTHFDLCLPDGLSELKPEESPLARALRGESVADCEMVIRPQHGAPRMVLASARPLFKADGEKLGALTVMHDITERKRAQETLKTESALMQALMDNIPDAIYFKDTESRFTRVNRHAPYRGNLSPADVVGKTDFDFFVEEHARAAYEDEQRIMLTRQPTIDKVEQEIYPDGSVTWLSTTKVPIIDEAGRVTGLVGVSRDITERKLAEEERMQFILGQAAREEAEAANRFKDEFLAVVSHELRTPLTPILGWSKMLLDGTCEGELKVNALQVIERNAKAQLRIIDDLLDVSRILTGKLKFESVAFDPAPVVKAATDAMRPMAEAKSVELLMLPLTELTLVTGDALRLQQIILNLLSNAIKFTPKNGRIEVSLRRDGAYLEIMVKDNGAGIKPEFLPHVFERFRQADSSTSRMYGGLGLGLSIVRHLTEMQGGTVGCASAGEGQGASFTVRLPLTMHGEGGDDALPSAATSERGVMDGISAPLRSLQVLIVDDETDTLDMLSTMLRQFGAVVTTANSTGEAMRAIRTQCPDVLITDIGMPGEDGYDLIRRVRTLPAEQGGGVAAVALTAYAAMEDGERALRAGFQRHLAKPVELADLVSLVADLGTEKK